MLFDIHENLHIRDSVESLTVHEHRHTHVMYMTRTRPPPPPPMMISEDFLVHMFQDVNLIDIHGKRVMIMEKDMILWRRLVGGPFDYQL